jgi:hypothetical protein
MRQKKIKELIKIKKNGFMDKKAQPIPLSIVFYYVTLNLINLEILLKYIINNFICQIKINNS